MFFKLKSGIFVPVLAEVRDAPSPLFLLSTVRKPDLLEQPAKSISIIF